MNYVNPEEDPENDGPENDGPEIIDDENRTEDPFEFPDPDED